MSIRKVKILEIVNSFDIGGAEITIMNLIESMNKGKYEVSVLILGDSPFYDVLIKKSIHAYKIKLYTSLHDILYFYNFINVIKHIGPDILHAHIWRTCYYTCLAGVILKKPVISTFHSNYILETKKELCILKTIYTLSKYIVFVSDYQKKLFNINDKDNKIIIIKNGVVSRNVSAKLYNLDNRISIISVANLRPIKGHEYLIHAIKLLSVDYNNIKLFIIGEGQEYNNLKSLCSSLDIEHNVSFEGFRGNVFDYFSCGDIFISASLSETTSMAVLEAMSFGIPVVATDVGGTPEIILNYNNGILVKAKDSQAIASSIKLLIENKYLYENISLNNINSVKNYFNVNRMSAEYVNLFKNISNIYDK